MDKAIKYSRNGDSECVRARDLQARYPGSNIPEYFSFLCPNCQRRVIPVAFQKGSRTSPYFRHESNDEEAQNCENYQSGLSGKPCKPRRPSLPIFLRKSRDNPNEFFLEIGIWRSGELFRQQLQKSNGFILIEEKKHRLSKLANPQQRPFIPNPQLTLSTHISVQATEEIRQVIGNVEDAKNLFIFDDAFGQNGGHRISEEEQIQTGKYYYLVSPTKIHNTLVKIFGPIVPIGKVPSNSEDFEVSGIRIDPEIEGHKRSLLASLGFILIDHNPSAQLIWPPAITDSYGAQNRLFSHSQTIFKMPLHVNTSGRADDSFTATSFRNKYGMGNISDVGFLGLSSLQEVQHTPETSPSFIRPGRQQPWLPIPGDAPITELALPNADETTITLDIPHDVGTQNGTKVMVNSNLPVRIRVLGQDKDEPYEISGKNNDRSMVFSLGESELLFCLADLSASQSTTSPGFQYFQYGPTPKAAGQFVKSPNSDTHLPLNRSLFIARARLYGEPTIVKSTTFIVAHLRKDAEEPR
jgi:hypothetical protein